MITLLIGSSLPVAVMLRSCRRAKRVAYIKITRAALQDQKWMESVKEIV